MARPAEKARAMMNKWVAMRDGENKNFPGSSSNRLNRRPHLASECEHLADAERFRGQILHEISTNIAKIQNPTLPEYEIRTLNDTINKLQREKFHWQKRIVQLGGVDYNAMEKKRRIEQGDTQLYSLYRYYGVAKDLPGVQEHLAKEAKARSKHKLHRSDLHKFATPDYYGWRDEEDGVLLELESAANKSMMNYFNNNKDDDDDDDQAMIDRTSKKPRLLLPDDEDNNNNDFFANVPTQDEVAAMLLAAKKRALMKKYAL